MRRVWSGAVLLTVAFAGTGWAAGQQDLDRLIERFGADAPQREDGVRLDAWIEAGTGGGDLVVVVEPEGEVKLVADPGITVTPSARPGVKWGVPLPHREVDPDIEYFTPPATIRLPFSATAAQPIEVLVEYAYCVVDYQCFFGEQTLQVAAR